MSQFRLLDTFCGMGGVSDGFSLEGFDVAGIDIVDAPKLLGYKHRFIQADIHMLRAEGFRGYDVIWGSPPCRDFCEFARLVGHLWKNPPNPTKGIELVNNFFLFVKIAHPTFWILENNPRLAKYINKKPRMTKTLIGETMRRSFWGNFPLFLMPQDMMKKKMTNRNSTGKGPSHMRVDGKIPKNESWERAKIPLACSRSFARACREALEESVLEVKA